MPLFYQRKETPNEIIIMYKNWILYFLLGMGLLGLLLNSLGSPLSIPIGWAFVLCFAVVFVDTWKPNREIRKAKMKNGVYVKGSYFSFSGSITVIIKKEA